MRNADGSVIASSAVSLTFKIHDGSATGTIVYQESHALTSNAQGLVSCVVGNGVVSQGNFASVNWGGGAKFLQVMMGSGATQVDLGTQQMLSVPYALNAASTNVTISATGDTLSIGGNNVIVPGISVANPQVSSSYNRVFYYFHGGAGPGYPGVVNLTSPAATYNLPTGVTSSLSELMNAMITGTPETGFFTQVQSFTLGQNKTLAQAGAEGFTWTYLTAPIFSTGPNTTTQPNQYYYLAVPTNEGTTNQGLYYPEDLTTSVIADMHLQINGNKHQASEKKAFTYNNQGYMLYRLGLVASTLSWTVGFD
jgi:hypothetical protein